MVTNYGGGNGSQPAPQLAIGRIAPTQAPQMPCTRCSSVTCGWSNCAPMMRLHGAAGEIRHVTFRASSERNAHWAAAPTRQPTPVAPLQQADFSSQIAPQRNLCDFSLPLLLLLVQQQRI